MAKLEVKGLDKLQKALKDNATLSDVKKVVRHHGSELQERMQSKADFKAGYQTGQTKRSIGLEIQDSGFTAEVGPTTEYSPYVEYGTRFMDAQPFVRPALDEQAPLFKSDLQKLMKQVIKIDPQQELFTALKLHIEKKGHTVYEGQLPPDGTLYPFDYMGDNRQSDKAAKNAVTGVVHQTIHIWHNNTRQRGTVSEMQKEIKAVFYQLEHTANYAWGVRNVTQRIFTDTSTATPLLHGVIEADFYFSQENVK